METAIEGLRLGSFDYITKPFDADHILSLVKRALEHRDAKMKLKEIKSGIRPDSGFSSRVSMYFATAIRLRPSPFSTPYALD